MWRLVAVSRLKRFDSAHTHNACGLHDAHGHNPHHRVSPSTIYYHDVGGDPDTFVRVGNGDRTFKEDTCCSQKHSHAAPRRKTA